ncbi:MAG: TetR/AcrR family transcriptional regulator [Rhodobacteraceae bacterium]|nr:TetR/AcrR family transcriptional regulator [Paracoccaceae bacterium]
MPDGNTEIRKGRKFNQVVEGATEIFMTEGYERASVDEIARRAGVSKATLYSYFPDKRLLFVEVMKRECEGRAKAAEAFIDKAAPPDIVLPVAGRIMVDIFLSEFGQQTYRMSIGESGKFRELGQRFFDAGPGLIERELVPYFEEAEERGELKIEDKILAAHQFAELCKSHIFPLTMLQIRDEIPAEERDYVVTEAVKMFMARYGTTGA